MQALEVVEKQTGIREVNAVGYCIGGTLLMTSLAYMAGRRLKSRVKSATLLTTLTDFSDPGDIGVFIDEHTVAEIITIEQAAAAEITTGFEDFIATTINNAETGGGIYTGENNLGIAQGVIIENVKTGSGNDDITDNEVDNHIETGAGDDTIHLGSGGFDTIDGGEGNDALYVNALVGDVDIAYQDSTDSYELVTNIGTDDFGVRFTGIETLEFSDGFQWDGWIG